MSDEASSATRRGWTETHIGFPTGRVTHGNGPGVQAIVRGDGVHEPTTRDTGQRKQRRTFEANLPEASGTVINQTLEYHLLAIFLMM
jgi:hypothetical protein